MRLPMCSKIQVKFFEFLASNYPEVMGDATPEALGAVVFKKVSDKTLLSQMASRPRL